MSGWKKRQAEERLVADAGCGARVAYLLLTLLLVQYICPLLFVEGTQWWVSAGLVIGHGLLLYRQLRLRIKEGRA